MGITGILQRESTWKGQSSLSLRNATMHVTSETANPRKVGVILRSKKTQKKTENKPTNHPKKKTKNFRRTLNTEF